MKDLFSKNFIFSREYNTMNIVLCLSKERTRGRKKEVRIVDKYSKIYFVTRCLVKVHINEK